MSIVCTVLLSTYFAGLPPLDRAQLALENAPGINSKLKVTLGGTETASGTFSCRRPNLQRLRLKNPKVDSEFLQAKDAVLQFDHLAKSYSWYPRFKTPITPPEDASAFVLFGLPDFLSKGTIAKLGPASAWVTLGKELRNGTATDVIGLRSPNGGAGDFVLKLWIDSGGKIRSFMRLIQTEAQPIPCQVDFSDIRYSDPGLATFEVKLPWGYVPDRQPLPHDLKVVGEAIEPCNGLNMKTSKFERVPLKDDCILIFLSNDLTDQSKLKWETLAREARRLSVKIITVWLGEKKPPATQTDRVYFDSKGEIEQACGPPYTPYLMSLKDGVVMAGWHGWQPNEEAEAIKTAMRPFEPN